MLQLHFTPGKGPWYLLDKRLGAPWNWSGWRGCKKTLCLCRGSNPDQPAYSQSLYWLRYLVHNKLHYMSQVLSVHIWSKLSRTCSTLCTRRCSIIPQTAWTCHLVTWTVWLAFSRKHEKAVDSGQMKMLGLWWFQQENREFFVEGIHELVHQLDACLKTHI